MNSELYPNFKEEEEIAHLGANMYWTGSPKARKTFLGEIGIRFDVLHFESGMNDEMTFAIIPKA